MEALGTWWTGTGVMARWRGLPLVRRRQIWAVVLLAVAFPFPFVMSGGYIDAAANAFTFVLLALGLNIVVGFAGLLDLGYAAFFAVGAYAYGVAASSQLKLPWSPLWTPLVWLGQMARVPVEGQPDIVQLQFSFWAMLAVGGLICALFGVLFGAPTLRLRGDYLAIVTLGFGEIVPAVARNWDGRTDGAQGLGGMGSVRGVVLAALLIASLQSVILQELTLWVNALGRGIGSPWLARIQLITSLELIFGLILVLMMLFRRQGLFPAARRVAALSREQQATLPARGVAARLSWATGRPTTSRRLLEIGGLSQRFGGVAAADGIGLTVDAGELISVIGPNGSGKTTLFNLITGLTSPDAGVIRLDGQVISGLPSHDTV